MKSMLVLKKLKVSNANAIAGLTWGFPAITNFLGFTHALSRYFKDQQGFEFKGCGVICHDFQHKTQINQYGRHSFALTRNPLTKKGETAPFNEEGKMHMTVSLVLEADFYPVSLEYGDMGREAEKKKCEQQLEQKILTMRLAGGLIESMEGIELIGSASTIDTKTLRYHLRTLLPGFALVDSSHLLPEHLQQLKAENDDASLPDAWLDFAALKYKAESVEETEDGVDVANKQAIKQSVTWQHQPKPGKGYLVPLMVGYKGISPLYDNEQVSGTRDDKTPFRFVESAYGVGQWVSPHRIRTSEQLLWQYQQYDDWYLCKNGYHATEADNEEELNLNDII